MGSFWSVAWGGEGGLSRALMKSVPDLIFQMFCRYAIMIFLQINTEKHCFYIDPQMFLAKITTLKTMSIHVLFSLTNMKAFHNFVCGGTVGKDSHKLLVEWESRTWQHCSMLEDQVRWTLAMFYFLDMVFFSGP